MSIYQNDTNKNNCYHPCGSSLWIEKYSCVKSCYWTNDFSLFQYIMDFWSKWSEINLKSIKYYQKRKSCLKLQKRLFSRNEYINGNNRYFSNHIRKFPIISFLSKPLKQKYEVASKPLSINILFIQKHEDNP